VARTRISAASLAGSRRSPLGLAGSAVLHGLVIAATLFTFSHHLDIVDESTPVVPVDLVTLAAKTNVRAMVHREPKIVPEVKPTPAPPTPTPPAPPVPVQAPPPQQQADAPPLPEKAAPEPIQKPPVPQPRVKPQEPPKKAEDKFDLDKLDALLNKVAPTPSRTNARSASRTVQGIGDQTAMTADLQAMLLGMIKQCWNPPVGVPHPESLVPDFDVILNPDGSVARSTQLPGQGDDSYARAAADAARRAIYTCQPYKLPVDRYSQWREINPLHFDPRKMNGD
jgi:outer membrane biosynthesis protein TonB